MSLLSYRRCLWMCNVFFIPIWFFGLTLPLCHTMAQTYAQLPSLSSMSVSGLRVYTQFLDVFLEPQYPSTYVAVLLAIVVSSLLIHTLLVMEEEIRKAETSPVPTKYAVHV